MARLNERVAKLEKHISPAPLQDVRLLSHVDPDFDKKLAENEAAGAFTIVLVGIKPERQHEAH